MNPVKIIPFLREYKGNLYLLLDGLVIKNLHEKMVSLDPGRETANLYYDTEYEDFSEVSPCLIAVDSDANIFHKFMNEKEYAEAGILMGFKGGIIPLKKVLANSIEVQLPSGDIKLLRFHDPHVVALLHRSKEYSLLREVFDGTDFIAWFPDISCYNDEERELSIFEINKGMKGVT